MQYVIRGPDCVKPQSESVRATKKGIRGQSKVGIKASDPDDIFFNKGKSQHFDCIQ